MDFDAAKWLLDKDDVREQLSHACKNCRDRSRHASSGDRSKGALPIRFLRELSVGLQSTIPSIFQPKFAFLLRCVINGQLQHNPENQACNDR